MNVSTTVDRRLVECYYFISGLVIHCFQSPHDGNLIRCRWPYFTNNADPTLVAEYGGYVQGIVFNEIPMTTVTR